MRTVRVLPRPRPATRNLSLFDSNGGGKTPIGLPKWARLHALKGTGALFKYHRVGIGCVHPLVTEIFVHIVFSAVQTLFLVLGHLQVVHNEDETSSLPVFCQFGVVTAPKCGQKMCGPCGIVFKCT